MGEARIMKDFLECLPYFNGDTNYWIVRSGVNSRFFDEFKRRQQIALGWNMINDLDMIKNRFNIEEIKDVVEAKYGMLLQQLSKEQDTNIKRRVSDISGKINRFVNELKVGDIVLTPGKEDVLIGEVLSDAYIVDNIYKNESKHLEDLIIGDLNKVRNVKWIKRINRDELEPNLKLILNVNHGIAHIENNQVITEVNRTLYKFYIKGNEGHSIFRVKTQDEIDFDKYALFIHHAYGLYNVLKNDYDNEKLSIKTNIQSPGPIEFIGEASLVGEISIALFSLFRNDEKVLSKLDSKKQEKIKSYKEDNPVEEELDDYEFPYEGEY